MFWMFLLKCTLGVVVDFCPKLRLVTLAFYPRTWCFLTLLFISCTDECFLSIRALKCSEHQSRRLSLYWKRTGLYLPKLQTTRRSPATLLRLWSDEEERGWSDERREVNLKEREAAAVVWSRKGMCKVRYGGIKSSTERIWSPEIKNVRLWWWCKATCDWIWVQFKIKLRNKVGETSIFPPEDGW